MATIPGTKYAQGAPSESTGQVLMSPPSEGGGQQIAAGIEKMGAVIMAYAINVQKQEMSVDYYERKRQIDEAGWEAHNAVTGDIEADNKLWEKFESDAQAIAQSSKYKDVNSLLANHLNQVAPNWHQGIYTRSLTIRKENARDQLKLEWTKSLENGDTKTTNDLLANALKLGAITQAEHDNFMKIAPAQAHLLRAERALSLGNNEAVLSELDQTKDMKLTTEQLKQKESLRLTAEKKMDDLDRELTNEVIGYAIKGVNPQDFLTTISENPNYSPGQINKMAEIYLKTYKTWQQTGQNPFTVTRDYNAFIRDFFDMQDGKITNHDELRSRWLKDGVPAYGMNYFQMLDKMIDGDNLLPRGHEAVSTYVNQILKEDMQDAIEKMSDSEKRVFALTLTEVEKNARAEKFDEAQKVINEYKGIRNQKKAKKWLNTLIGLSPLGTVATLTKRATAKPKLAEPKTQTEYDALPSGTQYKHPDGTIKVKK